MARTVAVVGGGIAGLSVAYELRERASRVPGGLEVTCLEISDRPGGNIRTDHADGFTCEWGPNGFLDNSPPTLDLVKRAGFEDRLLVSNQSSAIRFIYRDGKLRKLPGGALSFVTSDVLTWPGKISVFGEPFRRAKRDDEDESVFSFASRRIGTEAAKILVDAMVTGIYAGDSSKLSLEATFPKMHRMERDHGGLVKAMFAKRREGKGSGGGPAGPGGRLTSFRDGLEELPAALAKAIGPSLRRGIGARAVADMGVRGFRVHATEGAPIDADAVVLACPSWHAAEMLEGTDDRLAAALAEIPSASLAVVHLGYAVEDLPAPPDGFGFLIPRGEGVRTLGTLWSSCIFDHRAPAGHVLLTSMIGGARDPDAVGLSDKELLTAVRNDLRATMGIEKEPRFVRIFRHPRGIPQYTIGHPRRMRAIEARLAAHPGLHVSGNSYRGISVNACIAEAAGIAEAVLARF
jgi:oxygen-dependent protoporphyrinogen oxidase